MKESLIITLYFLLVVFCSGLGLTALVLIWLDWITTFERFEFDIKDND